MIFEAPGRIKLCFYILSEPDYLMYSNIQVRVVLRLTLSYSFCVGIKVTLQILLCGGRGYVIVLRLGLGYSLGYVRVRLSCS